MFPPPQKFPVEHAGSRCRGNLLRGLYVALSAALFPVYAQQSPAPPSQGPGQISPLSPEESLKRIRVPKGYRVELVAADPLIEEPVMCAWDGNGRMYVAEMRSYMQDTEGTGGKERNGRVKRLEDADGDGKMDRSTVFVDGLLLPRIVMPLDDRIIIRETHDPHFVSYRDTDGDGRADERIPLGKGIGFNDNVEHEDSGLLWNLDNWLYTAKGGWRYRFTRGSWEAEKCEAQQDNQWGLGMDDVGTLYFSHNSFPGRGFQQPWYAWSLLPIKSGGRYTRPRITPHDTTEEFHQIFPLPHVGDRQDSPNKTFTSCCGISIYRGDALPDLRGDMFICEPCSHMVRRAKVEIHQGKRSLRNAQDKEEFFASDDFYCRPIWSGTGPDGCLYIVDMYRGIIQDKPWVDGAFAKRIKALGADQVNRRGRIWRIVPEDFHRPLPEKLLDDSNMRLVPHLAHANGFVRDTAQRLLVLRHDASVIPALQSMSREHADPIARLHALWTLEGLDAMDQERALNALNDKDPRVRAAGIRLCEPWIKQSDEMIHAKLSAIAGDPDISVLRQLILSLGWSPLPASIPLIESIVSGHLESEIVYLAAMTALWGKRTPLIERLISGQGFQGIPDPVLRNTVRLRWKQGILAWQGTKITPRSLDADAMALVDGGAAIYAEVCGACHGPDGKGLHPPGSLPLAPALDGSERLRGQKERLVRIVLHGLKGHLDGKQYAGDAMPALGSMNDTAIASALTYARQAWANDAEPIRVSDVAAVRLASKDRTEPWLPAEVDHFAAPVLADSQECTQKGLPFPFKGYRGFSQNLNLGNELEPNPKKRGPWIHGPMTPGHWFAVDLQRSAEITAIVLETREPHWYPRSWDLRISQDGKIWSAPIASGKGSGPQTAITVEPTVTRFFKVTLTAGSEKQDPSEKRPDLWQVSDFRVHGREVPVDLTELLDEKSAVSRSNGRAFRESPVGRVDGKFSPAPGAVGRPETPQPGAGAVSVSASEGSLPNKKQGVAQKSPSGKPDRLRVLIVDGQSNHDFRGTTEGIRSTLASTGRFGDWSQVKFSRSPVWWGQAEPAKPKEGDASARARYEEDLKDFNEARQAYHKQLGLSQKLWRPAFEEADVVVVNYYGERWPEHVQEGFEEFVRKGGGAVIVHAANNSFENWASYNAMLGIGWRGARFGRWIAVDDATNQPIVVSEEKPASSSHGDFAPFVVKNRAPQHPIMEGIPTEWMHGADELYVRMRGTAENLSVLASAFSPGAKQHEPVLWCTQFGKGRVVTTSLGHYQSPAHFSSLNCVGFQTLLARSCEWAASGAVTIPVPVEFPGKDSPSIVAPKGIHWRPR